MCEKSKSTKHKNLSLLLHSFWSLIICYLDYTSKICHLKKAFRSNPYLLFQHINVFWKFRALEMVCFSVFWNISVFLQAKCILVFSILLRQTFNLGCTFSSGFMRIPVMKSNTFCVRASLPIANWLTFDLIRGGLFACGLRIPTCGF